MLLTKKIKEISKDVLNEVENALGQAKITIKTCLCDHLGNGALINLGIKKEGMAPQAVCPGQNISWFNRKYSLIEMMEHFYNKKESLISKDRPHMFAKEIQMYVDYYDKLVKESDLNERVSKTLKEFYENLKSGMEYCRNFSNKIPYASENIKSIKFLVDEQKERLEKIYNSGFGKTIQTS